MLQKISLCKNTQLFNFDTSLGALDFFLQRFDLTQKSNSMSHFLPLLTKPNSRDFLRDLETRNVKAIPSMLGNQL